MFCTHLEENQTVPYIATQSEIKQNTQGTNSEGKETRAWINNLEQKEEINIQLDQNE